jgi:hypothetical protein
MKKRITLAVLIITSVLVAACYKPEYNDASEFEVAPAANGKSLVITKYTGGRVIDIRVPPRINNKRVTEIGDTAFYADVGELLKVTIPNGIVKIGDWAFSDNYLEEFTIPKTVKEIGPGAFANNRLNSITIPNSVRKIGYRAFVWNPLTGISIGKNVELETLSGYDANKDAEWKYCAFELGYKVEFDEFYKANGRKAGTYMVKDGAWTYQGK